MKEFFKLLETWVFAFFSRGEWVVDRSKFHRVEKIVGKQVTKYTEKNGCNENQEF